MAFNKELDIRFSLNYSRDEFRQTLHDIAEGRIDTSTVLTSVIESTEVEPAFADLSDAERQAKIVVSFE